MKKRIYAILIAACLALSLTGCGEEEEKTVKEVMVNKETEPRTTLVQYRDIESTTLYDGQVSYYTVELSFPEEGKFGAFQVALGDTVTEGQTLATTDLENLEDELERLTEQAESVKSTYETNLQIKQLELDKLNIRLEKAYYLIDQQEYMSYWFTEYCSQACELADSIAQKELEISQLTEMYNLEYPYYAGLVSECKKKMGSNIITAPFDGVVVALDDIQQGDHVNSDTYYIAVADTSKLVVLTEYIQPALFTGFSYTYAFINGSKYELEYLPIDDAVYLKIRARDEKVYSSILITNPDENVSCTDLATFVGVKASAEHVLSIPAIAINRDSGGTFVYTKVDGERTKTYVKIGVTGGNYSEVTEGLKEGDEVYEGN